MRHIFAVLVFALWSGPASAGAWMREPGTSFISLATQSDLAKAPRIRPGEGVSIFAEHGLGPRVTIGIDGWRSNGTGAFAAFLRLPLSRPGGAHNFALDLALGGYRGKGQPTDPTIRLALGWGRGFRSPLGPGWAQIESSIERRLKSRRSILKTDLTLGFSVSESRKMMFQTFVSREGRDPVTIKLAPSYVMKIGARLDLVAGLVLGLRNSQSRDLVIGTWISF